MAFDRPTYKTKRQAIVHGYLTYGKTKNGARKFKIYKVKNGWNVMKR